MTIREYLQQTHRCKPKQFASFLPKMQLAKKNKSKFEFNFFPAKKFKNKYFLLQIKKIIGKYINLILNDEKIRVKKILFNLNNNNKYR